MMPQPKYQLDRCSACGQTKTVVSPAWLRQTRALAGVTLREMARRLGLSAPYLSDVELGRRRGNPNIVAAYEQLSKGDSP